MFGRISNTSTTGAARAAFGLAVLLVVGLCGCNRADNDAKAAADTVKAISRANDILDGVQDESDAESAAAKLQDVANDLNAIADRRKKLPEGSGKGHESELEGLKSKLDAEETRFKANLQRLQGKPAVMLKLADPIQGFARALSNVAFADTERRMDEAKKNALPPTPAPTFGPPQGAPPARPPAGASGTSPRTTSPPAGTATGAGTAAAGRGPGASQEVYDRRLQLLTKRNGADKVVTLRVSLNGVPESLLMSRLYKLAWGLQTASSGNAESYLMSYAPVPDIDAFAAKIDFGTVTGVDRQQRVIAVTADPAKLK